MNRDALTGVSLLNFFSNGLGSRCEKLFFLKYSKDFFVRCKLITHEGGKGKVKVHGTKEGKKASRLLWREEDR